MLLSGSGCGSAIRVTEAPAPPPPKLALGLSELNPALISPGAVPAAFAPWRDRVAALAPDWYRLFIDWAQVQPSASAPADLSMVRDGCARGTPPCAAYAGVAAELRAVAAAQLLHPGRYRVLVVLYGVPDWAAAAPAGCERPRTTGFARAISPAGLRAYRGLIGAVAALGRRTGVALARWAPWNEPNTPGFISPQRATCSAAAEPVSPAVYAELARAARAALPPSAGLVLGELASVPHDTPLSTSIGSFVAALPDDVACGGAVWSVHAYVPSDDDPVAALESALASRPCTAHAPIWVTETGAGGPRTPASLAAGCAAQAAALERWNADSRVRGAFQYSFREDVKFPVGLADASLGRAYPAYGLWRAWAAARVAGGVEAPPAGVC